jgi:drug/metabolite transporter (DMT)-like permease
MTSAFGGLLAAVLWGASGAVAGRSARLIGGRVAVAWAYVVGLVVALPIAVVDGAPNLGSSGLAWTSLAASTAVSSLYLMYAALQRGPVALVMPLTSSQGAFAAVVAIVLGERLRALAGFGLALVMLGMGSVIRSAAPARRPAYGSALLVAALSAALGGICLYASARASASIGTPWLLTVLRATGVLAVTIPLAASGGLVWPRPATRLVVFCGLADTAGFASFIVAAAHGSVVVAAIVSSQFAAVSVVIGVLALGERLSRGQASGVAAILAGVALVTAAQS